MKNDRMLRYFYKGINIICFLMSILAYVVIMFYLIKFDNQQHIVALLAAFGTTVTVFLFIRDTFFPTYEKRLSYYSESTDLDPRIVQDLKILGVEWDKDVCTHFMVWNSGTSTILREDIASLRPLVIKTDNQYGISAIIRKYVTDVSGGFTETFGNKYSIVIDFDYIKPEEGFEVWVIHKRSEEKFYLDCVLKEGVTKRITNYRFRHAFNCSVSIILLLTNIYALFGFVDMLQLRSDILPNNSIMISIFVIIVTIGLLRGLMVRRFIPELKPECYEEWKEEYSTR